MGFNDFGGGGFNDFGSSNNFQNDTFHQEHDNFTQRNDQFFQNMQNDFQNMQNDFQNMQFQQAHQDFLRQDETYRRMNQEFMEFSNRSYHSVNNTRKSNYKSIPDTSKKWNYPYANVKAQPTFKNNFQLLSSLFVMFSIGAVIELRTQNFFSFISNLIANLLGGLGL
jgi:hypothetical protein